MGGERALGIQALPPPPFETDIFKSEKISFQKNFLLELVNYYTAGHLHQRTGK